MLIEGQEVVTRPTANAARASLIISVTVVAIELYDVPIKDLEILGVALPVGLYRAAVTILLGYGAYNLLLWLDAAAYLHWFEAAESYMPLVDGGNIRSIHHHLRMLEDLFGSHHIENSQAGKLDELRLGFNCTKRSFAILSWSARYFLFIHHGLVPLALTAVAAWLVFFTHESVRVPHHV